MASLTVELKNPPAGAELWYLKLCDWNITTLIRESRDALIGISEISTFEIPDGLTWPLRVVQLQIVKWNLDHTAVIQLYYVQSMNPTLWDFDLWDYGNEPDPTYREIFIPSLGDYFYNVATEAFESAGPPLSGIITQGEIIVGGQRLPLGSPVVLGESLVASLTVQNTSDIAIEMGVYWQLLDPSSTGPYSGVRQEHNSTIFEVPPGSPWGFDGPALTVDIEGNWGIYAELYGRVPGGAWELLATLQETLCVASELPPAEFRNFSLAEYN